MVKWPPFITRDWICAPKPLKLYAFQCALNDPDQHFLSMNLTGGSTVQVVTSPPVQISALTCALSHVVTLPDG